MNWSTSREWFWTVGKNSNISVYMTMPVTSIDRLRSFDPLPESEDIPRDHMQVVGWKANPHCPDLCDTGVFDIMTTVRNPILR